MTEPSRDRVSELFALGLASFSVLGSQIAMTRILSLKYAANQTFLVVSFAVLGLAIGAAIAHRMHDSTRRGPALPPVGMLLFAVTLGALLGSFYLNLSTKQQIVLVPLPFVGVGLCIADVFSRRSGQAGFYYAVDLAGAAVGAFGAAPLLDRVSAPTALLLFSLTGVCSAVLFLARAPRSMRIAAPVLTAVMLVAVAAAGVPGRWLGLVPIYPDRIKDMLVYIDRAKETELDPSRVPVLESSHWSAFGRTDVVNDVARRQRKILFVDGAAGSPMFAAPDTLNTQSRRYLEVAFGPSVVLGMLPPEEKRSVLAIGSGGGRDVLACRLSGVGHVTAVELNPDVVAIVTAQSEFNGGLHTDDDRVDLIVEEGRHFLRGSGDEFDVILLSIPVTKRGESYGGFALSESYLFTRESMQEYLEHLTAHGTLLIVCHTRQEVGRLLNTYLASVEGTLDPESAMQRVAVFGETLLTVLISGQPRPEAYWRELDRETRRHNLAFPDKRFYYMPGLPAAGPGNPAGSTPRLAAVAAGLAPAIRFPRQSRSTFEPDMSAVTDDRPFFYFFTGELPPLVRTVVLASGAVLLVMLFWSVFAVSVAGAGHAGMVELVTWRVAVAGLGIGFMLAEIAFIQRFVFWFGRPTLALGLLLGTLLLATGLGSLLAGRYVEGDLRRTWPLVAVLGLAFLLLFLPIQSIVFAGATGALGDSMLRSMVITVPMGLLMGVPFPMLLTAAGRRPGVSVAWLWGVNGVGSVLGSASAIAIAMMIGYSTAMQFAGAVYLATAAAVFALTRIGRAAKPAAA